MEICWVIFWEYKVPVWSKIWFKWEKRPYTVQASNIHFCICTKPFSAKKTVLYTIIDWVREIRWWDNLIFWMYWYETKEDCEKNLTLLMDWDMEVSHRRNAKIRIAKAVFISDKYEWWKMILESEEP